MEYWVGAAKENGGVHPNSNTVDNRLLGRMPAMASNALQGADIAGVLVSISDRR